jgi:hypothetical protein
MWHDHFLLSSSLFNHLPYQSTVYSLLFKKCSEISQNHIQTLIQNCKFYSLRCSSSVRPTFMLPCQVTTFFRRYHEELLEKIMSYTHNLKCLINNVSPNNLLFHYMPPKAGGNYETVVGSYVKQVPLEITRLRVWINKHYIELNSRYIFKWFIPRNLLLL